MMKFKRLNYLEFFLLTIAILLISNTSALVVNDVLIFVIFMFVSVIYLYKKRFQVNHFIVYLVGAWYLINIFSYLYNGTVFPHITVHGYVIQVLLAYFIIRIIGADFWEKLEKYIYILTFISIPLFILSVLFTNAFVALGSVFGSWAAEVYRIKLSQQHFWYSFIYTFNGKYLEDGFRNCGFLWEPGAFSMVIIFALLYNLYRNNFVITKKIVVYSIALITTFSTMGYIAYSMVIFLYVMKKRSLPLKVGLTVILIGVNVSLLNLDFIAPKINSYLEGYKENHSYLQEHTGRWEVNRILSFAMYSEKIAKYPLGYGVVPDKYLTNKHGDVVVGINGLGKIMFNWGILGLIFLIYALRKYIKMIFQSNVSGFALFVTVSIFLVTFFSNPIERNFFLFALVLTPFLPEFKRNKLSFENRT